MFLVFLYFLFVFSSLCF